MERSIKFRLRDRHNKIVGYEKWYPGSFNIEQNYWVASPCWLYSEDGQYWNPTSIVHSKKDQYTGLKDKNGKEIFEGGIVDCGTGELRQVRYNSKQAAFKYYSMHFNVSWEMLKTDVERDEIIGNIYEDPELLEARPGGVVEMKKNDQVN